MKRTLLVGLFLLIAVGLVSNHLVVAADSPDDVVRQFYAWYVGRLVKDDFKPLKNRTVSLKYLTPQFLQRVPRLTKQTDADPIICAQDFDPAWEKNIKVDSPSINGNRATTTVQLDGAAGMHVTLKITLKRTAAGWRIDNVDCGY
jgi:hypothetical protein